MSRSSKKAAVFARFAGGRRLAVAIALAGCLAVAGVSAALAATASKTTVVLGGTATMPDPSCPELPCQAVGSVTGFQVSTEQGSLPFRVRKDAGGKLIVTDLQVEGIWLALSQRSDFTGFLQQHNGRIEDLIGDLKRQTEQLRSGARQAAR